MVTNSFFNSFKKTQKILGLVILTICFWKGIYPWNNFPFLIEQVANSQTADELKSMADQLEREGIQLLQMGNPKGTIQSWQQALKIYETLQDYPQAIRLLENFGLLFIQLKAYPEAVESLEKGIKLAKQIGNVASQESILIKLAQIYREQKQDEKAFSLYQQILVLAKQLNDKEGQITALGNVGTFYSKANNYTLAIENYTEVLNLSKAINDKAKEVLSLKAIGDAYYLLGNCEYAQAFYEWGLMTAEKLEDKEPSLGLYQNHGNATYCQGKFELAIKSYQQGLALAKTLKIPEAESELIGNIGLVNVHLGNYEQAITYLKQDLEAARQRGNKIVEAQALGSLGDAYYAQNNYQQALTFYQQSLAIAKTINYSRGVALMLTNIGATLLKLNQLLEAEKNLKEAIVVFSNLRAKVGEKDENKLAITERGQRTYRLLQEVLVRQNKLSEALEMAEAGRNRTFVELLNQKFTKKSTLLPPTFQSIQQIAHEKDSVLIEYSLIYDKDENKDKEQKLYIWSILPNGKLNFKQVELTSENINLSNLINNNRQALNNGSQLTIRLQKLYQILIAPIADQLPTNPQKNIIFIPQEELFLVPFVALKEEDKYLIEKHTILTSPSIQFLQLIRPQKSILSEALVVGNPTMPFVQRKPNQQAERLESLPGTEKEAISIAEILKTQAIIGSKANKVNLLPKMQKSRVIHLATHGLLVADVDGTLGNRRAGFGDGGAIALAPEGKDNGLLTVDEIMDFKLDADLVVLSACDTGRGNITADGVIGLSRSFLNAGARGMIVSLWLLPDLPTATLTTEFYSQWEQIPNKAQALRIAMLKTMKQYPNPRDWAAFTFVGEAQSLK